MIKCDVFDCKKEGVYHYKITRNDNVVHESDFNLCVDDHLMLMNEANLDYQ